MFASIRRHQNWIWYVVVVVIIISFVVFFSPTQNLGHSGQEKALNLGTLQGKPITRDQYVEALRETRIFFFLRSGQWPESGQAMRMMNFDVERETYNRLLIQAKVKEMNIHVSPAATAQWTREVLQQIARRPYDSDIYTQFTKTILPQGGVDADDFARFAEHEVARQHLVSLFGMSGRLVTPQEAQLLYRRQNEQYATEAVFFNTSNYLSKVTLTPQLLGQFFTNNMPNYRVPERVKVSYVRFPSSNYFAQATAELEKSTNLTAALEAEYIKRGTNTFTDATGKMLSPEAAKAKIRTEAVEGAALRQARIDASNFLDSFLEAKDKKVAMLEAAKSKNLKIETTAPFDHETGSKLAAGEEFVSAALRLNELDPVPTQVILANDGAYIMALDQRFPSQNQSLDAVRQKVTEDFRLSEAGKLSMAEGEKFATTLTNGLAQGKTLATLAAEAKVKSVSLPLFSASTRTLPELENQASLGLVQNIVEGLQPGKASSFIPTREGGMVLFLKSRIPADEAKMKLELPAFVTNLRDQRQYAAFAEWFQKQGDQLHRPETSKTTPQAAR